MLRRSAVLGAFVGCGMLLTGCNLLLPAHTESNYRKGEKVTLKLLDYHTMRSNYAAEWQAAFGTEKDLGKLLAQEDERVKITKGVDPATAGLLASIAGDLAVRAIKHTVKQEASRHVAQYGREISRELFAIAASQGKSDDRGKREGNLRQNYWGFELQREAAAKGGCHTFWSCLLGGGKPATPGCRLVCGICPSAVGDLFMIAPLRLQVNKAKAKVLSDQWPTSLMPWCWPLRRGHAVKVAVRVQVTGTWFDSKANLQTGKVADLEFTVPSIDLVAKKELKPDDGLPAGIGWFGIPRSFVLVKDGGAVKAKPSGTGAFRLQVTVTETDPSYTEKVLGWVADTAEAQKPAIVNIIKEQITAKPKP